MKSQRKQSSEKENIEKKEKETQKNRILEKVYFGGRRPFLRKNKVYFGEGRKNSQRGDNIFGTIFSTALPLVGETVKVFK